MKMKNVLLLGIAISFIGIFNNVNVSASSKYSLPKKMQHIYKGDGMQYKMTSHYGYLKNDGDKSYFKFKLLRPKHGVYQSNYGKKLNFRYINRNTIKLHLYNDNMYMHIHNKSMHMHKKTTKTSDESKNSGLDLLKPVDDSSDNSSSNDSSSHNQTNYTQDSSNQFLSNGTDYNRESNEPNPDYDWNGPDMNLNLAEYVYNKVNGLRTVTLDNLQPLEIDNSLSAKAAQRAKELANNFSLSSDNELITEVPVTRLTNPESASIEASQMMKSSKQGGLSKVYSPDMKAVGVGCYYKDGEIYTSVILEN